MHARSIQAGACGACPPTRKSVGPAAVKLLPEGTAMEDSRRGPRTQKNLPRGRKMNQTAVPKWGRILVPPRTREMKARPQNGGHGAAPKLGSEIGTKLEPGLQNGVPIWSPTAACSRERLSALMRPPLIESCPLKRATKHEVARGCRQPCRAGATFATKPK